MSPPPRSQAHAPIGAHFVPGPGRRNRNVRVVPRRGAALTPAQRGALTAAGAANALIFLDQTSLTVALPAIQHDFHSSTAEVQWTIGAYLLVLASLMAGSGRLADLYGRRRLFLAGVALFGVSSPSPVRSRRRSSP
jgi:hypothetical protein